MPQLSVSNRPIDGPSAWVRADVRPEDWRVELSAACLDEIRRVVDELRAYPLPTIVLGADDFAMPACREAMARARGDPRIRRALCDRRAPADGRDERSRGHRDLLAAVEHDRAPGRAKARRHPDL